MVYVASFIILNTCICQEYPDNVNNCNDKLMLKYNRYLNFIFKIIENQIQTIL